MTDFDFDCMQKKRIAQGARHRKCGSKSRMCFLPTDHMTQKQWKERNGSCMTMNLNKPMSWEDFKHLPAGMQTEYLQHITDTYKVGKSKIAKDVFGCSDDTLAKYVSANGLRVRFCSAAGSKSKEQIAVWNRFLGIEQDTQDDVKLVPAEEIPVVIKVDATNYTPPMKMDSVSLRFSGELDIQMIANSLRHVIGDGTAGTLTVLFCAKDIVADS